MSKYERLWRYLCERGEPRIRLSFQEIGEIAGVELDHSFLRYKKELPEYGYEVEAISMKERTVLFRKR